MTKPKLLLADDSITIRKVVELTFADEGVDVSTVADAESAMLRFVEIQPDIVLVDVGLSGTNGYQICEMIKADEATKHIPVLLLVGSFEPFDQAEAERVNADGFLTKPFHSIRDLVARVWELLGRKTEEPPPLVEELPPVPTFGDAFTDEIPLTDEPESDDIEDLYRSSFAETAKIEEFDTVEDMFDDDVMDDEMIETNRIAPPENSFADISNTDTANGEVKEFDWSPDSIVGEPQIDAVATPSYKPKFFLEEIDEATSDAVGSHEIGPGDDEEEKLWLAETGRGLESTAEDHAASLETIEISHAPDLVGAFSFSPANENQGDIDDELDLLDPLDPFDFKTPDTETASPTAENNEKTEIGASDEAGVSEAVDPAIHDTIPYEPGEQPPVVVVEPEPEYFSPELIERIAQRVIERLSDSVVREVAKEEVPRIAEKLIREALEQENKG